MKMLLFMLFWPFLSFNQTEVLIMGNTSSFCFKSDSLYTFTHSDTLPSVLTNYKAIFIFSGANSSINNSEVNKILEFASNNKGIYVGSEEWPLQAESKLFNQQLYNKDNYGIYTDDNASLSESPGQLGLEKLDSIPAGKTTVAFPMDYRLKVEAWIEDQPLILSGPLDNGRIILDGGYSRFYCGVYSGCSEQMFYQFLNYLTTKNQ